MSPSLSQSISPSLSPSISPSISPSPSPGWTNYTKGDYVTLPTDDTDLENVYSAQDILDVAVADEVTVGQVAELEFIVHQFKDFVGDEENARIECKFMSTQSPTNSTVYLQIYNQVTNEWETLEENSTASAYEYVTFTHEIQDLTDYKNSGIISCRIYQEALYG